MIPATPEVFERRKRERRYDVEPSLTFEEFSDKYWLRIAAKRRETKENAMQAPRTPLSPQACIVCGEPVATNVKAERVTGLCDECIAADPNRFEEMWQAVMSDEAGDAR